MAIQEYIAPTPIDAPNITLKAIAWFAGIMEGEGSFMWHSSPIVSVSMTDQDIVQRVADLIGYEMSDYVPKRPGAKRVYEVQAAGARAAGWMMTLYPFMGIRRRAAITKVLTRWKKAPGVPRGKKGERLPAFCHPDRLRSANGLCKQCYQRAFMQTWRLKTKATCHPDRTVKGYGLCNVCYLREYRAKLAGQPSKLDDVAHKVQIATCHPERPHFSKGLCGACYMQQWRNNKVLLQGDQVTDEPSTEPEQLTLSVL